MVTPTLEALALIEHFLSLFGDIFTYYFNVNSEILFLCVLNMGQHILKISRIIFSGFALENSSNFNCYINAFLNFFTMNSSFSAACLLIFTLYAAMVHPLFFSKHYKRIRPYVYAFIIIYTATYCFAAVFEPVVIGYDSKYISQQHNCSSAYRSKFYQYLCGSPFFNLPFALPVIYCSIVIIHKIVVVPRSLIKKQITTNTKMSFTRWVKILCYAIFLSLLSFINLYCDIKKGINATKGIKEYETLGYAYFITASSGILIFLFTNSRNQMKRKFGIKIKNDESINDDTEYILPSSSNYTSATSSHNSRNSSRLNRNSSKLNKNNSKLNRSSTKDVQSPVMANNSVISVNTSFYQNAKPNEIRSPTVVSANTPRSPTAISPSRSLYYLHKLDDEIRANTSVNHQNILTDEIRSPTIVSAVNTSFNQNILPNEIRSPTVASAVNTSFNQNMVTTSDDNPSLNQSKMINENRLSNDISALSTSFNQVMKPDEIRSPTVASAVNTSFNQAMKPNEIRSPTVASAVNTSFNQAMKPNEIRSPTVTSVDNTFLNQNKMNNENSISNDISANNTALNQYDMINVYSNNVVSGNTSLYQNISQEGQSTNDK